jgi:hypothetical protein
VVLDLDLNVFHLIIQVSQRFENIGKALSISQLQALLEVLQSFLKA